MIHEVTKERVLVKNAKDEWPYVRIPLSQLDSVRKVLDRHQVHYWPDSFALTFDHKPPIVVVNFDRTEDGARIQKLLDEAD